MSERPLQQDYPQLMKQALRELREMKLKLAQWEQSVSEPLAIVGLGCRFPGGAHDADSFWQLLCDGVDPVTEIPADRWPLDDYYDPAPGQRGKMYSRLGSFLDHVDQFDASFFGISSREAAGMDPQQRLLLEVSWEAFEHAGISPTRLRGSKTGVFIGAMAQDYAQLTQSPELIDLHTGTGNAPSILAGRLSHFFGFRGPTLVLDTACSSSLVSVHLACQSLRAKECDCALAGGVNLILSPMASIAESTAQMLAPDGRCKTFDAAANGIGRGEGVGVVLIKRLSDAQAQGDPILALVRGSAVNHDGKSSGLTVPSELAQEELLRQALRNAKVTPAEIGYIEAHGTGTSLGDPIELNALGAVLGTDRNSENPLWVGSVKTNLGHLEGAAGIAGLIKLTLALQRGEIPPSLHFKTPNPHIPWSQLPIKVPIQRTPWPICGKRRIAGISAFGLSGTNAHFILEEAPSVQAQAADAKTPSTGAGSQEAGLVAERPCHLLTLSAKTKPALLQLAARYRRYLLDHSDLSLGDICFTAHTGRTDFACRLGVTASSSAQMAEILADWISGKISTDVTENDAVLEPPPQIAFLFPDASSSYFKLGRELFETEGVFRRCLKQCDEILWPHLTQSLVEALFSKGQSALFEKKSFADSAVFAIQYALAELWKSWGVEASVVVGQGIGEYAAACVAGSISLEDGLRLAVERERGTPALAALAGQDCEIILEMGPSSERCGQKSETPKIWLSSLSGDGSDTRQMLRSLSELFTRGIGIDWLGFDRVFSRSRVALPAYPWQRQRYWVEQPLLPGSRIGSAQSHPLLGQRLHIAGRQEIRFESQLSHCSPRFLSDHQVYQAVILPGAAYLEMALAAGKVVFDSGLPQLEDVVLLEPLILPEKESKILQLAMTPEPSGDYSFQIFSLERSQQIEPAWTRHASGRLRRQDALPEASQASSSELEADKTESMPGESYYVQFHQYGIDYGPAFHTIQRIWLKNGAAHGAIRLPEFLISETGQYCLHPVLMDACFQLLGAALGKEGNREVYLPVGLDRIQVYRSGGRQFQAEAQLQSPDSAGRQQFKVDLRLWDEQGLLAARIDGLTVRRASRDALLRGLDAHLHDALHEVIWQLKAKDSNAPASQAQAGHWLILADQDGLALDLAKLLKDHGERCTLVLAGAAFRAERENYFLNPADPAQWDRLMDESSRGTAYRGVIHLWSLDEPSMPEPALKDLFEKQRMGCESLLHLTQSLARQRWAEPPRLWLVTREAQGIEATPGRVQAAQASLWGLAKVVALEHPEFRCVCVDLDGSNRNAECQWLLRELWETDGESQVAFRGGQRHIARLARKRLTRTEALVPLNGESGYLVTGGLGALGLQTARWMVEHGARYLTLVGRRAPSDSAREVIADLARSGAQIQVVAADVSNREEVSNLLKKMESSMPPLRGVIHAAGVLEDGVLLQQTWERFERVLAPKAKGAWNLHLETKGLPLDFFILFSSSAALLGSPGQGNYAAANAFMDALAHHRRSQGLAALSINWGPWLEQGMAGTLSARDQSRLSSQGLGRIAAAAGLRLMGELMKQSLAQVGVLPVDWAKYFAQRNNEPVSPFMETLAEGARQSSKPSADLYEQIKKAPVKSRRALLETAVRAQLAKVLGVNSLDHLAPRQRFFDLGLDSLMAVDLKNRLQSSLGRSVSASIVFDYPTLEALVQHLADDVLDLEFSSNSSKSSNANQRESSGELSEMSDDEIADLLASKLEEID